MNQLTVEVVRVLDTTVSGANDFKSRNLRKTLSNIPNIRDRIHSRKCQSAE
jgi:hypothetical protein